MNQEGGFTHRRGAVGAQPSVPLPGAPTAAILFILFACCGAACSTSAPEIGEPIGPAPQHVRSSTGPTTWYIRPDGGPPDACTGQVDAAYPGTGSGKLCAWDHPFRALPPGGPARLQGGDTLVIAPGTYRMGYGAPGAESCDPDGAFDCHLSPIPSGPTPDEPTRILGAGWDSGCSSPPELWGTERSWMVLNLTDSSNAVIACLEITDHAGCIEDHSGSLACKRTEYPFGDWAGDGLYAEDSNNIQLSDLNIHGLANTGIRAGRLSNWSVENVQITANGWAGWDGDIEGEDANTGTMVFKSVDISWNGCGERWPEVEPQGCWSQTAGGYGDGFGTGNTGGDWIFEDSVIAHNTSDGLDLLYHTLDGKITLNRVRVEGNAGNQVKSTGPTTISNSVLVGNCGYFDGQPFTYAVDSCRALGNTLALFFKGGEASSIFSTTLYGQGDGLVFGAPHENFSCTGDEALTARNNIFLGDKDFFDFEDQTFLFYQEGCPGLLLNSDYDLFYGVKDMSCGHSGQFMSSGSHDLCQKPQFTGPLTGDHFGLMLSSGSPGINAGNFAHASGTDILGNARDAFPDLGAYEWQPD